MTRTWRPGDPRSGSREPPVRALRCGPGRAATPSGHGGSLPSVSSSHTWRSTSCEMALTVRKLSASSSSSSMTMPKCSSTNSTTSRTPSESITSGKRGISSPNSASRSKRNSCLMKPRRGSMSATARSSRWHRSVRRCQSIQTRRPRTARPDGLVEGQPSGANRTDPVASVDPTHPGTTYLPVRDSTLDPRTQGVGPDSRDAEPQHGPGHQGGDNGDDYHDRVGRRGQDADGQPNGSDDQLHGATGVQPHPDGERLPAAEPADDSAHPATEELRRTGDSDGDRRDSQDAPAEGGEVDLEAG